MENTLESAGELIDYIQILLTDFHGFYIIHLEVCILIDPFLWCSGLRFFPNTWFTFVWLIWNGYNRIAGKMIIIALLFCLCILIFHLDRCTSFVSSRTICYSIISLTIYITVCKTSHTFFQRSSSHRWYTIQNRLTCGCSSICCSPNKLWTEHSTSNWIHDIPASQLSTHVPICQAFTLVRIQNRMRQRKKLV